MSLTWGYIDEYGAEAASVLAELGDQPVRPIRCPRCAKPAADVAPMCPCSGMPHCIAPRVRQEGEVESQRQQLRGAVARSDELLSLLRLVRDRHDWASVMSIQDTVRAALDRLGGQ